MKFQVEHALKHRVVLFGGEEELIRQRAMKELMVAAGIEKDDFDLQEVGADEMPPMEWVAAAGTAPFLADRRTVVVRHLLRLDIEDLQGTDLSKLPESAFLLLVADEEAGGDDRQQRLKRNREKWQAAVQKAGGAVYIFDSDADSIRESIKQEVAGFGKTISEQAAVALVEMTGGSLSRALDELDKLRLFIGDEPQIRESDVRSVVMPSREWNVYKMVEAAFGGRVPEALRQLRVLTGSATKAEDAAFQRILPTVSRQLRLLWQARACVEANCTSPGFAPPDLAAIFPEKNSIVKEKPYRLNSLLTMARRLSFAQIERCFTIVSDTDARLKGGLPGFSPLDTLERMLLEMAAAVTPPR